MRKSSVCPITADVILDLIAGGESLRKAAKICGVSPQAFLAVCNRDELLAERYARAIKYRAELLADELIEIADEEVFTPAEAQRQKLRVDARKWIACKLSPQRYGDHKVVDINVKTDIAGRLARARDRGVIDITPGSGFALPEGEGSYVRPLPAAHPVLDEEFYLPGDETR